MKRGELYRVYKGTAEDPKKSRVFVVVSRQVLIDSKYSTVVCAPVYSSRDGLSTQVPVGIKEGLKYDSAIHCDGLVSLEKSRLKGFVGSLTAIKMEQLHEALRIALEVEGENR